MKVAYVNIKLIIEKWESGTWSWFLVPYLSKRLGYFKIVDRDKGTGNQLLVPYVGIYYQCFKRANLK